MLKITPKSLERQAADTIREANLSGDFAPGSRFTELSLVSELNLSRGTIRGALQQLSFEGLVTLSPFRGWSVVTFSSGDAWEIYTLRNALEGLASRILAPHGHPRCPAVYIMLVPLLHRSHFTSAFTRCISASSSS